MHCVTDSVGAAIWPALMNELVELLDKVSVLHKGQDANREEYSIFKSPQTNSTPLTITVSPHDRK